MFAPQRNLFLPALFFCAVVFSAPPARANTIILYSVANIGANHWEYTYNVSSDHVFNTGDSFAIFFDVNTVTSIDVPPPPPLTAGWTPQVFQPDAGIPADGELDEIAQGNNASLANPFSIDFFTKPAAPTPGSQSFQVFDSSFTMVDSGTTSAPIPEPASWMLLAVGLAAVLRRARILR